MILNLELKYGKDRESFEQPHVDRFMAKAASDIITRKSLI